jgi:Flp pilus assembly protein TadG
MLGRVSRFTRAVRRRADVARAETDGGYSVLEAAITVPMIFFLLMAIVQWAIVWHARNVAQAAATEGLRTAQAYQSTGQAGQTDATNFLNQTAPHALAGATVTVDRGDQTVTVRVHAPVLNVIPFGHFTVDESASGPTEKFVAVPQGFTNSEVSNGGN